MAGGYRCLKGLLRPCWTTSGKLALGLLAAPPVNAFLWVLQDDEGFGGASSSQRWPCSVLSYTRV